MRIVVLGGTGFVGRTLCETLVRRSGGADGAIVVPTRRLAHGKVLTPLPTLRLVQADVHDDAELARAVAGSDAAINLVAILHGRADDFDRVHVKLPRRLAAACAKHGVRRLIHVSALGVSADAPSLYLRSKSAGEDAVRASGLDWTLLRPSVMFGAEDRFLNLFAKLLTIFPVLPLAGAHARFQPVWVGDVAEALARCLDRPDSVGQTIECAGPKVYTLAELVRCVALWTGHRRPVIPLPDGLARLQAALMALKPGEPLMSVDNLRSMKVDNVAGGTLPGLQSLGIEPAALEAIAPQYLAAADPNVARRSGVPLGD